MLGTLKPVITEASMMAAKNNWYTFAVPIEANKNMIREEVEKVFGVKVLTVKTMIVPGKTRRNLKTRKIQKKADWKKALVQVKEGQKIELFEVGV